MAGLTCSRPECERAAAWQPMLCVPVVREAERDVVHMPVPLVFCDEHRLSRGATAKFRSSLRLHHALRRRLGDRWEPHTERAWIERTRIAVA
jgi:hypothetical protein